MSIEQPNLGKEIAGLRKRQLELMAIPPIEGLTVAGFNWPATEISGDGYGIILKRNAKFFIFDITDHGAHTAVDWGMVYANFNIYADMGLSPLEVVHHTEHHLQSMTKEKSVPVTALYGEIDPEKGLTYVHAGHVKPLIWSKAAMRIISDVDTLGNDNNQDSGRAINTGTAVQPDDGVPDELNYYSHKIPIGSGDAIVFYTDGITESRNTDGKSLGEEGFTQIINKIILSAEEPLTADYITEKTAAALKEFLNARPVEDDCTMLVIVIN